ncbi:kinase-like protein [Periconia macrospinosa]|uniref:Kinase-like protein n=1 Tax=Periconia macrospinosa TaxID=97972 RepID=A0A2V1EDC8_9PLEO|nr:kinase-like protein [Periconia macrospinosa]
MSMFFRRPSDSSSSGDESSENRENRERSAPIAEDTLLSKINTLDSAPPAEETAPVPASSSPLTRSGTNDQLRDLLLHSLLEDKALKDTADRLGKSTNDPAVQQTAKATYQGLAQRFSHVLDHTYASDDMKKHRATAFEGIDRATRAQMTGLAAQDLTTTSASQALIAQPALTFTGAAQQVASSHDLNQMLGLHTPIPSFLQGIHGLHTDRYERDFSEIELVGKGGYGKVYKVKHNLDNSFYAVKRITVSHARMQNISKRGAQEMECLLEEVRSLARLEHANIVRYHNAWLEYKAETPGSIIRQTKLLEDATSEYPSTSFGNTYDDPGQYSDAGVVFEASDTGAGAQESIPLGKQATRRKDRRASEVTVATISSTLSHTGLGGVEDDGDVGNQEEAEDDEDVEEISRTVDESSSMMSNSDMPTHLITTSSHFATGPNLTLNVQMSLYDSNLCTFLSSEDPPPTHCYHTCISLELVDSILSGVDYLHARGIVHRDLKPANIFLSLSADRIPPAGSVPLHTCRQCPGREFLYVTPRIGDFGLVAALSDNNATSTATATSSAAATIATKKPVGTEFYRPPTGGLTVNEKLDVYSLGVVTFELLRRFETRMERIDALSKLRHGELPEGFGDEMGLLMGREVERLLIGMLREDEDVRFGCAAVRKGIEDIVSALKK